MFTEKSKVINNHVMSVFKNNTTRYQLTWGIVCYVFALGITYISSYLFMYESAFVGIIVFFISVLYGLRVIVDILFEKYSYVRVEYHSKMYDTLKTINKSTDLKVLFAVVLLISYIWMYYFIQDSHTVDDHRVYNLHGGLEIEVTDRYTSEFNMFNFGVLSPRNVDDYIIDYTGGVKVYYFTISKGCSVLGGEYRYRAKDRIFAVKSREAIASSNIDYVILTCGENLTALKELKFI